MKKTLNNHLKCNPFLDLKQGTPIHLLDAKAGQALSVSDLAKYLRCVSLSQRVKQRWHGKFRATLINVTCVAVAQRPAHAQIQQ